MLKKGEIAYINACQFLIIRLLRVNQTVPIDVFLAILFTYLHLNYGPVRLCATI